MRHLPNFITCLNLLAGCIAVVYALKGELQTAGGLVLLAGVFDFLDGFFARLLNAHSRIGKQLDSLADVISFGLAPATIIYGLFLISEVRIFAMQEWAFSGFIITVFSALRLARFNIDELQSTHFIGLPTPACGITISALPFIMRDFPETAPVITNSFFLLSLTIVMSFLLVAPLPLIALKFKREDKPGNRLKTIFLAGSLILIILLKFAAVPVIVALYILLSLTFFQNSNKI